MPYGFPLVMNAFAAYRYVGTGIDVDANEVVHLRRNPAGDGWTGHVVDGNHALVVDLDDPVTGYTWTMRLTLDVDGAPIHTFQWLHTQPDPAGYWNTGVKIAVLIPREHQAALRIMG